MMFFIALLALTTTAIAGSAAFFSVYGLASTFSGAFWSVVLMGGSLEAGKLIACSYLYRYWNITGFLMKTYLISGVVTLMVITSVGIFGFLSVGYQTEILPLKQAEEQILVLEDEKARKVARKQEIDDQISQLPPDYVTARIKLAKEFEAEQKQVTDRINELDAQMLELKTKLLHTQAHIGPITYIASALGAGTDDATKYLIFLIIFAFDPMALALTLAVNIAIKQRQLDRTKSVTPALRRSALPSAAFAQPQTPHAANPSSTEIDSIPYVEPAPATVNQQSKSASASGTGLAFQQARAYWDTAAAASVQDVIKHYNDLIVKHENGTLTQHEGVDVIAIEDVLRRRGLLMYVAP